MSKLNELTVAIEASEDLDPAIRHGLTAALNEIEAEIMGMKALLHALVHNPRITGPTLESSIDFFTSNNKLNDEAATDIKSRAYLTAHALHEPLVPSD